MDSRRRRKLSGVMVALMAERLGKVGATICFEDGPRDDGGDGPCSVRCSLGVCLTGVGPNPGSGLEGTPGFRC